jgi:diguanylate cyclase
MGKAIGQHATLQTAEAALLEITARGQAADPRSYALWYNFASGESGLLTTAVNKRLAESGTLTRQDIDAIYTTHISPGRVSDRVDKLGAQVANEIDHVTAMVEAAEGSASNYSSDLADVSRRLGNVKDRAGIHAIVKSLTLATREREAKNSKIQLQLQAMWQEIAQLRRELEAVRNESLTDALTSLGNRKYFKSALEKSVAECRAGNAPLSLILADIDHFRKINNTYGHLVGDRVIRFVASTLQTMLRGSDIAARYGGEEFAVILPKTPPDGAVHLAEQLRQQIMKGELIKRSTGEKHAALTISIGVAALHRGASPQALIEAAELCLYAAKRSGRNCVVSEADEKLLKTVAE